jgi:hypothetical protein
MSHHHHQKHHHAAKDDGLTPASTDTADLGGGALSSLQLPTLSARVQETRTDASGVIATIGRGKDEGATEGMHVTFTDKDGKVIDSGVIVQVKVDSEVLITGRHDAETFQHASCTLSEY